MPRTLLNVHVYCSTMLLNLMTITTLTSMPAMTNATYLTSDDLHLVFSLICGLLSSSRHDTSYDMWGLALVTPRLKLRYNIQNIISSTLNVPFHDPILQDSITSMIHMCKLHPTDVLLNVHLTSTLTSMLINLNLASILNTMLLMTIATYLMSDDPDFFCGPPSSSRHDTRYDTWGLALVMPGPKFRYIFKTLISSWLNVSFYDPTLLDADLTNHMCNLLMLFNATYPDIGCDNDHDDLDAHDSNQMYDIKFPF